MLCRSGFRFRYRQDNLYLQKWFSKRAQDAVDVLVIKDT